MGISPMNAAAICREHVYRPFTGRVFVVGRQTMLFHPAEALLLLAENGLLLTGVHSKDIEVDHETRAAEGQTYITDRAFFRLLGVENLQSIDVSDYEGASVIHDLNEPLPPELEGIADVIVDGSTLDNVFDPAMTLRNLCRMLRPGGRLLSFNVASNHYAPYTVLTPLWFYDYFVANRFADYRVYLTVFSPEGPAVFAVDPSTMTYGPVYTSNIETPFTMGLAVFAEKGDGTTWDKTPIQAQYRSAEQNAAFREHALGKSERPDLFSSVNVSMTPPAGYRLVPPVRIVARA